MKRRYALDSPIFYAMMGAYFAGDPLPPYWHVLIGGFALAAIADALERWYVGPRRRR